MSVCGVGQKAQAGVPSDFGCFLFGIERPKVKHFPMQLNACPPFPSVFRPGHTAKSGRDANSLGCVLCVTRLRDCPQVRPTVVECVTVNMVAAQSIAGNEPQNLSMKQYALTCRRTACGVTSAQPVPAALTYPLGISSIDNGVRSDAAISGAERDTHGIIGLHRTLQRSGVAPRDVQPSPGLRCVNYTPSFRVGAV